MQHPVHQSDHQFTLRTLFFWTTLVAICLLPLVLHDYYPLGFILAFVGIVGCLTAFRIIKWPIDGITIALVGLILFALFWPQIQPLRKSRRPQCSNNMRQISLALLNYESVHGQFPPAYTVDAKGNRLHSWRTLILPFMEEQGRFNRIDFTLPWDHPKNAACASPIPDVYRCFSEKKKLKRNDLTTSYIGIIGDNQFWQNGGQATTLSDISDGLSNTISIIELPQHRLHWMSPNDLQYAELLTFLQNPKYQFATSAHSGGTNVARGDGSVTYMRQKIPNTVLKAALTINDGIAAEF